MEDKALGTAFMCLLYASHCVTYVDSCVYMYMYTCDILVCVVDMHVLNGNRFLAVLLCESRGTEQQQPLLSLSDLTWYFSLTRVFVKYSKNKSWQQGAPSRFFLKC